MAKEIKYGADARAALGRGVDQLAETVRVPLKECRSGQIFRRSPHYQRRCYHCKGN